MSKDKLKHVAIADIHVGERFRIDLGNMDQLVESIKEKGILQPITLSTDLELLAGGRRLEAARRLGLATVPALLREISDEVDLREIELIENIHRQDFTWDEQVLLIKRIDELYREKDQNWTTRKTAQLLDISVGGVSDNIKLANAIAVMPDLLQCKNKFEATKLLKKVEEDLITQELLRRQQAAFKDVDPGDAWNEITSNSEDGTQQVQPIAPQSIMPKAFPQLTGAAQEDFINKGIAAALKLADGDYHVGDVFAGMKAMRTQGKIDFIECDPPYGIDLTKNRMKDAGTNAVDSYQEVAKDDYQEFLTKLCTELYRVAGKDCWMVFWFGPTWQHEVLTTLRAAGWLVDEIPALWLKPTGQTMQPEIYFARCYEPFFVCRKGNPVMALRGQKNYFGPNGYELKAPAEVERYHPTQRSKHLIKDIMQRLLPGRSNIFIPFLGSGATLRACYDVGHRGRGFDINGEYKSKFMLAVERDARVHLDYQSFFGKTAREE